MPRGGPRAGTGGRGRASRRVFQLACGAHGGCGMIEVVEFTAADGVALRGELHPGDQHWAILVHDRDADLDSLAPLAAELAQNGFTVLAFDQRGHGLSDGTWTHEGATLDVE